MLTLEFLRHFRFAGYAIFDLTLSFLGIYLLSSYLSKIFLRIKIIIPKINWIFLTLPLGILFHIIFGTFTPMTLNFLDPQSHYYLKILIIILLIFGLRKIKISNKN